jgi:hypothetical protein
MGSTTTKSEKVNREFHYGNWFDHRWRPAMGWMYMAICIADFLVFPVFWTGMQVQTAADLVQWVPITMGSGGMFHVAMGAIVGVTAWQRSKEKIALIEHDEWDDEPRPRPKPRMPR